MKKVLSVFVALCLIVSTFAFLELPANALSSSGKCGENVRYTFNEETGLLTISGSGDMYDYDAEYDMSNTNSPFNKNSSIKSVIIEQGVTSVGNWAFYGCSSLESVTIPNSVTSIYHCAFFACSELASIAIGDSITSIFSEAFSETAYYNNPLNWESNVLYIGNHLIQAKEEISGKYSIKPNTVCIAENAFYGCDMLESVTMPNSVTSIGSSAFYYCTSLTDITISNNVTNIDDFTFSGCDKLASVIIPNRVTSIGNDAFSGCDKLESVTIPNSLTSIGYVTFADCPSLVNITVDSSNKKYDSRNNCNAIIETSTNTLIVGCKDTVIPESVTTIGHAAFCGSSSLTSITIPSSVTSIRHFAFQNCSSLESITIPSSVTSINHSAFWYCSSLKDVYYMGDKEQWHSISIDQDNDELLNATIHYTMCTHNYISTVTEPTCTKNGERIEKCTLCGEIINREVVAAATGHIWNSGEITTQPTDTNTGIKTFTCVTCGEHKTEIIPKLGHELDVGIVATSAKLNDSTDVTALSGISLGGAIEAPSTFAAKANGTIEYEGKQYVISYWNVNGRYIPNNGNKTTISIVSNGNYNIIAYYIPKFYSQSYAVTFVNRNNKIIGSINKFGDHLTEEDLSASSIVPDSIFGYEFLGWDRPTEQMEGNIIVNPVYRKVNNDYTKCTISADGGTINGKPSVTVGFDTKCLAVANDISGKKFVCWKDALGQIISKNKTYVFFAPSNLSLKAEYINEGEESIADKESVMLNTSPLWNTEDGMYNVAFTADVSVPINAIVAEQGILIGGASYMSAPETLTITSYGQIGKSTNTNLHQFMINFNGIAANKQRIVRGYVKYNLNGVTFVKYSRVVVKLSTDSSNLTLSAANSDIN